MLFSISIIFISCLPILISLYWQILRITSPFYNFLFLKFNPIYLFILRTISPFYTFLFLKFKHIYSFILRIISPFYTICWFILRIFSPFYKILFLKFKHVYYFFLSIADWEKIRLVMSVTVHQYSNLLSAHHSFIYAINKKNYFSPGLEKRFSRSHFYFLMLSMNSWFLSHINSTCLNIKIFVWYMFPLGIMYLFSTFNPMSRMITWSKAVFFWVFASLQGEDGREILFNDSKGVKDRRVKSKEQKELEKGGAILLKSKESFEKNAKKIVGEHVFKAIPNHVMEDVNKFSRKDLLTKWLAFVASLKALSFLWHDLLTVVVRTLFFLTNCLAVYQLSTKGMDYNLFNVWGALAEHNAQLKALFLNISDILGLETGMPVEEEVPTIDDTVDSSTSWTDCANWIKKRVSLKYTTKYFVLECGYKGNKFTFNIYGSYNND